MTHSLTETYECGAKPWAVACTMRPLAIPVEGDRWSRGQSGFAFGLKYTGTPAFWDLLPSTPVPRMQPAGAAQSIAFPSTSIRRIMTNEEVNEPLPDVRTYL